jgi:hypothetical protein
MNSIDIEELKSFLAKRGEVDLLNMIKYVEEEYEKSIDPDYSEEESDTESECSMGDIVQEEIEVNPSLNGFVSLA